MIRNEENLRKSRHGNGMPNSLGDHGKDFTEEMSLCSYMRIHPSNRNVGQDTHRGNRIYKSIKILRQQKLWRNWEMVKRSV